MDLTTILAVVVGIAIGIFGIFGGNAFYQRVINPWIQRRNERHINEARKLIEAEGVQAPEPAQPPEHTVEVAPPAVADSGMPRPPNTKAKTSVPFATVADMKAMYEGGATLAEVGAKFGTHDTGVRQAFIAHGIPRRVQGRRTPRKLDAPYFDTVNAMRLRYESGLLVREVAAEFGVNKNTVQYHFKRCGIGLRAHGIRVVNGREVGNSNQREAKVRPYMDDVKAMYAAGATQDDIAAKYGVDRQAIKELLLEAGVTLRKPRSAKVEMTAEQLAAMREAYAAGASIKDVAKQHGVSISTARQRLLAQGVQMRPAIKPTKQARAQMREQGRRHSRRKIVLTDDQKATLREVYATGANMDETAAAVGIGSTVARRILVEMGVPLRNNAGTRMASAEFDIAEARRRYEAGESSAALAKEAGMSRNAILKRLHAAGTKMRPSASAQAKLNAAAKRRAAQQPLPIEQDAAQSIADIYAGAGENPASEPAGAKANGAAAPHIMTMMALYAEGKSCAAIGKQMGMSETTVRKYLKAAGVEMRPSAAEAKVASRVELTPAGEELLVAMYREGATLEQTARTFGMAQDRARAIIVAAGEMRQAGTREKSEALAAHAPEVIKLYESGLNTTQVGVRFGVSPAAVCNLLRANNIELRESAVARTKRMAAKMDAKIGTIKAMYDAGESQDAIGKALGVSRRAIDNALKRAGITARANANAKRVDIDADDDTVIAMWELQESGKTLDEVAQAFDCKPELVHRLLAKHDLLPAQPPVKADGVFGQRLANMVAEYNRGDSLVAISAKYGMSREKLTRLLRQAGVTIRPSASARHKQVSA